MKITKKYLQKLIKEEIEKLVQEQRPATFQVDDQGKVDTTLYRMRRLRGDGGMDPEEANPIKRSHRVSGDIGAPTQERAHIMQAIKSVKAALAVSQKSGLGEEYSGDLANILSDLKDVESATRYMTTGTSAGYTG